jgi:eukaryotic-like serine/threonine-protein kinase
MTIASAGSLIDALQHHRLINGDQYARLKSQLQGRNTNPRAVAKQLVQHGWLTVFQINQLFAGKGKDLVIGAYRVIDRLGQGGLSQVYKAKHSEYDLTVALKVIKPEVMANEEGRQQFLQEIEAMARVDHPNIVQFCDADQVNDTCFFAMEYVEGTDLGKQIRLTGPMAVRDACDCVRQAALGLQHAHERNLVHRDIKPVNLFITQVPVNASRFSSTRHQTRPLIKILDWGLASLRCPKGLPQEPTFEEITRGLIGTADYLAPEQARNASKVDIRGDIYSLGCTFYYLLTGQPPFPDGTLMQKILQHQQGQPRPLTDFRADLPDGVAPILNRMLAKNPDDRFATPAAVALALLPFARAPGAKPEVTKKLPLKGNLPADVKDDTPLPVTLGGRPQQSSPRLPKAGAAGATDDTSIPK